MRGVEEDREEDGCFRRSAMREKNVKKQSECPTVRAQLPLRRGCDRLSICQ